MNEAGDISYSLNFRVLCYYLISQVIEIPKVKLTAEAKRVTLNKNVHKLLTSYSCTVFHTLSHGVIYFVLSVSTKIRMPRCFRLAVGQIPPVREWFLGLQNKRRFENTRLFLFSSALLHLTRLKWVNKSDAKQFKDKWCRTFSRKLSNCNVLCRLLHLFQDATEFMALLGIICVYTEKQMEKLNKSLGCGIPCMFIYLVLRGGDFIALHVGLGAMH